MAQIPWNWKKPSSATSADHLPQLQAACAGREHGSGTGRGCAGAGDLQVEGRVKDVEECIRKFRRKYRAALEERNTPYEIQHWITDLIGVRVVCLYEDEIEKVAHLLQSHFDVIEVTDKVAAVESTEAEFGYKGLHLDLRWNNAQRATPEHAAEAHGL